MNIQAGLKKLQGDKVIWMVAIFLSILSLLAVYSSISSLAYKYNGSFKYLVKHSAMLAIGLGSMYAVHKMKPKYFSRLAPLMFWISVVLLFLTLLFGSNINDASRWLKIPVIGIQFQTSDIAKIALVVYVAKLLRDKRLVLHDFREGVIPILIPIGIVCLLILPADLSTAALLGAVCFLMLLFGGVPLINLGKVLGMILAGIGLIYLLGKAAPDLFPRFDTWVHRIENFSNPESQGNFQVQNAQMAVYNGGLFPSRPGSGSSRNYLPHPYSDMIYAFIIEEYGSIIGGFGLMMLYLILLFRTIRMSMKSPQHFGGLMALGLAFMIVIQAFTNMAVAVNLIPTTGQPLPLVSLGGTSIILTCLTIGMILSVSRTVYNSDELDEGNKVKPPKPIQDQYAVS